jgi:hypothetical protein
MEKRNSLVQAFTMSPPPYIVRISGMTDSGDDSNSTGFIVTSRGHVLTCRHSAYPDNGNALLQNLKVHTPFKEPWIYHVIAEDKDHDIAVLAGEVPPGENTPFATIHSDWWSHTNVNDPITMWGYSATDIVSTAQRYDGKIGSFIGQFALIGLQGSLNPGDSGGPVLDANNRVIGVVRLKDENRDGQAMATPITLALKLLLANDIHPNLEQPRTPHTGALKHRLHEYPRGPFVPWEPYIKNSIIKAFVDLIVPNQIVATIIAANQERLEADPDDPMVTTISLGSIAPTATTAPSVIWRDVFNEARLNSPRMLASLLLNADYTQFPQPARKDVETLLTYLKTFQ